MEKASLKLAKKTLNSKKSYLASNPIFNFRKIVNFQRVKSFAVTQSLLVTTVTFSAVTLLAVACVTVNVNFPESTVQKATDDYVKDLYRAKEKGKAIVTPTPSPAAAAWSFSFISEAYAMDGFNLNFTELAPIKARQVDRVSEILDQKRAGFIGENREGKLSLRNKDKIKPLLLKKIESLVKDENKDRSELYEIVLQKNNQPASNLKRLEQSFSKSFQSESPSGTWVESDDGVWSQKP